MGNSRSLEFILELWTTNGHIYVAGNYPSIHIYVNDPDLAKHVAATFGGRVLVHNSTHDVVVSKRTLFPSAVTMLRPGTMSQSLRDQLELLDRYASCDDYTERILIAQRIKALSKGKPNQS